MYIDYNLYLKQFLKNLFAWNQFSYFYLLSSYFAYNFETIFHNKNIRIYIVLSNLIKLLAIRK